MKRPAWFNMSVAYYLFEHEFGDEYIALTYPMQMLLVGDYMSWVTSGNRDTDFRKYVESLNGVSLKDHIRHNILAAHVAWGYEA